MFAKRFLFALLIVVLALPALAIVPFAGAQEGQEIIVSVTPFKDNPILALGVAGEWDSGLVLAGNVLFADEQYHMFYAGGQGKQPWGTPHSIGYATSPDGIHWTKYAQNPVLERSQGGIPWAVSALEDDMWVLYFNEIVDPAGESTRILRATALAPTGPWTIDEEPVLETGEDPAWDGQLIALMSVCSYQDGFALFYMSQRPSALIPSSLGIATSPDGTTWVKYDDPVTTGEMFALSDPVFTVGDPGTWDDYEVTSFVVQQKDSAWDMFYLGVNKQQALHRMGYAYSADGIHWTRYGNGPILESSEEWVFGPSSVVALPDGTYYLYATMYSMTGSAPAIGLINVTITK